MKIKKIFSFFKAISVVSLCMFLLACNNQKQSSTQKKNEAMQEQLHSLLNDSTSLTDQSRYAIINRIVNNYLSKKDYDSLILFLTTWIEHNPNDIYNTYWLFTVAHIYMQNDSLPFAEYYFDRILKNYSDIMVKGQSIHFQCLRNLIKISTTPSNRIKYFNELITRFPENVSITELYERLALEYEKEGEWTLALKAYSNFLEQPDSKSIQIAGIPDAYENAKQLVDFNNSQKNWTFESLPALEKAIKRAISNYDWHSLDKYKAKVNFFAMNWNQDRSASNAQEEFSMRNFMRGNRIRYNEKIDDSSNPNEAYFRTTGWSQYISVWYLYFRKVNFPADPEIHGRWEWAGIYFGEKL